MKIPSFLIMGGHIWNPSNQVLESSKMGDQWVAPQDQNRAEMHGNPKVPNWKAEASSNQMTSKQCEQCPNGGQPDIGLATEQL